MNYSQKVYTISLLILLVVAVLLFRSEEPGNSHSGMYYGLGMILFTAAEVIVLLIIAFVVRMEIVDFVGYPKPAEPKEQEEILDDPGNREALTPKEKAFTYLVAAGLVAAVGFSVCLGGFALLD